MTMFSTVAATSYLEASVWALVTVSGIVIGAVIGVMQWLGHTPLARITAVGAGLILSAATVELAAEVLHEDPGSGVAALLVGALAFSSANAWLERRGAADRKRCGECVSQPDEQTAPNSGTAIALGTAMDAVPEALVLGLTLRQSGPDAALIAAIVLGNVPEALSGASGMIAAHRRLAWVLRLWFTIAAATVALTIAGFAAAGAMTDDVALLLQAFAAGALLALVAETMLPEASHGSVRFTGLAAASGFGALLLIAAI